MKQHLCLSTEGKTPDCQNCSVSRAGHLNDFIKLLNERTVHLKVNTVLADYEREDIISEFVIKVHKQIDQFHGIGNYRQQPAKFKTWANTIYKGVYADHCRKKLGRKKSSEKEDEPVEPRLKFVDDEYLSKISAGDTDSILSSHLMRGALLELIENEKYKEFCQILIDHYEWGKEGLNQETMAKRYGISHDNFRTTLSRARKHIKKALGMNNGQYC